MSLIDVHSVNKIFYAKNNTAVHAVKDVTFSCRQGEIISIIGPTGCGKTTLLRHIAGLEKQTSGTITYQDKNITGIHKDITLVFQQYSLFPWSNVTENIAFGMKMMKTDKNEIKDKVRYFIDLLGLTGFEKAFPHELSGGMQQRVALARAFAYDAKVLLMDEPFGALDERTRHRLQRELLELCLREHKTVLLVTHNIDEAIFLSHRILVMHDRPGTIIKDVPIDLAHPRDRRCREFTDLHVEIREILETMFLENN